MSARIPPEFPWSLRCRRYRSFTGCVINNDRRAGLMGAEEKISLGPWSLRPLSLPQLRWLWVHNDRGAGRIGAEEMSLFSSRGPGAPYRYCSYAGCCYDRGAGRIGAEEMGSLGWAGSVVT